MIPCSCRSDDIEVQEAMDEQVAQARLQFRGVARRRQNFMSPPPQIKHPQYRPGGVFSFKPVTAGRVHHQSTSNLVTIDRERPVQSSGAIRNRQPKVSLSQSFTLPAPVAHSFHYQPSLAPSQATTNQSKINFSYQPHLPPSPWMKNAVSPKTQDSLKKSQTMVSIHYETNTQPNQAQPNFHRLAMRKPNSLNIQAKPLTINNYYSPKEHTSQQPPLLNLNPELPLPIKKSQTFFGSNLPAPLKTSKLRKDSARSEKSLIDALKEEQLGEAKQGKLKTHLAVVEELPSPCYSDISRWPTPSHDPFLGRNDSKYPSQHSPQPPTIAESEEFSLFDNVRLANSQAFQ